MLSRMKLVGRRDDALVLHLHLAHRVQKLGQHFLGLVLIVALVHIWLRLEMMELATKIWWSKLRV